MSKYIHSKEGTIVKVDMSDFKQVTKDLGIDSQGKVQEFATRTAAMRMDKYVPRRTGTLKNTADYTSVPTEITYVQPYARNMYFGIDQRTGRKFTYAEGSQRGAFWDIKMVTNEDQQWVQEVQNFSDRLKSK